MASSTAGAVAGLQLIAVLDLDLRVRWVSP
jgi:hypothetical protein